MKKADIDLHQCLLLLVFILLICTFIEAKNMIGVRVDIHKLDHSVMDNVNGSLQEIDLLFSMFQRVDITNYAIVK